MSDISSDLSILLESFAEHEKMNSDYREKRNTAIKNLLDVLQPVIGCGEGMRLLSLYIPVTETWGYRLHFSDQRYKSTFVDQSASIYKEGYFCKKIPIFGWRYSETFWCETNGGEGSWGDITISQIKKALEDYFAKVLGNLSNSVLESWMCTREVSALLKSLIPEEK